MANGENITELHPVRFTNKQIEFIKHFLEHFNEIFEEEAEDFYKTIKEYEE